ncbi:hypothetical protein [Bradyrhizobium sp. CCBAU 51627]|uniref:hypothetical protein n=1 Tax=Bradyrhizobium sp. CCBAU 51627 TaxID=1325088 RepID=UPI002305E453|nr:hypothetical protein [Bradyrhizobium sp. CCBAU 51627]MDA9431724.1 hypothetical protein [Bradyrhizobium sp. CCBAU 51627]
MSAEIFSRRDWIAVDRAEIVDLVADPGKLALKARHVVRANVEGRLGQGVAQSVGAGGNARELVAEASPQRRKGRNEPGQDGEPDRGERPQLLHQQPIEQHERRDEDGDAEHEQGPGGKRARALERMEAEPEEQRDDERSAGLV